MAPLLSSATSCPQPVFKKLNALANKQWEARGFGSVGVGGVSRRKCFGDLIRFPPNPNPNIR